MAVDYKASNEQSRQALTLAGLSDGQAAIYEVLIQRGPLPATRLAFFAGVPRTLSYKYLQELMEVGLVSKKEDPGKVCKVAKFVPAHPLKLQKLADQRMEEAERAQATLKSALPTLSRSFEDVLGTMPGTELYAKVAHLAGKACFEPLSQSEQAAFNDLVSRLKG